MTQPHAPGDLTLTADRPATVTAASVTMFVGAALSLVALLGSLPHALRLLVVVGSGAPLLLWFYVQLLVNAVAVGLWLWMGLSGLRGRAWVPLVATGLFLANALYFLGTFAYTVVDNAIPLALLLRASWPAWVLLALGAAAVVLLRLPASSAYFTARSTR